MTIESAGGVTRVEIAKKVGNAFPADRDELLVAAVRLGARPRVLELLRSLPARRFSELRELWDLLPDVPIRRADAP